MAERYQEYLIPVTEEEGTNQQRFYRKHIRNLGTSFINLYSDDYDLIYSFPNIVGSIKFPTVDDDEIILINNFFNTDDEYRAWVMDDDLIEEELFIEMLGQYKALMTPIFNTHRDDKIFNKKMINMLIDFEKNYNVKVGVCAWIGREMIDDYDIEKVIEQMEESDVDIIEVETIWFKPSESLYEIDDFNINFLGG